MYVFDIVNEVMRPNGCTQKICNRYYHILQAVPKGNLGTVICTENCGKSDEVDLDTTSYKANSEQ